jgi:cytoskeletal protein RodZ
MQELKAAIRRPALNKKIALLLCLSLPALLAAYFYPFPQPQLEPTPSNTAEETRPVSTNTPQEASTTPPAAEMVKPPAPAIVPNTTVTATAPPAAPSAPATSPTPAPIAKATNYIRVQYFWNGEYMNAWMENFDTSIDNSGTVIKLPRQSWAAQDNPQGIIHLSPDDTIKIRLHNKSSQPWNNAHAILHYSSNGQTSTQSLPINALGPDETTDITIPISQYPLVNPQKITNQIIGQLDIEVTSDAPQEIRCSRYSFEFLCLP